MPQGALRSGVKLTQSSLYPPLEPGGGLSPVNESSGFTATSGNRYRIDTTSGNIAVVLPSSPADGIQVGFVLSKGSNAITFSGGTILGGLVINILGSSAVLEWNANFSQWEQIA